MIVYRKLKILDLMFIDCLKTGIWFSPMLRGFGGNQPYHFLRSLMFFLFEKFHLIFKTYLEDKIYNSS